MVLPQRKQEEIEFANARYREEEEVGGENRHNKRFYALVDKVRGATTFVEGWMAEHTRDKVVLDYCCGKANLTLPLGAQMKALYGIDISDEAIAIATGKAQAQNLKQAHFQVMDAENMTFPDDYFDVILVNGVLHHLDLDAAYRELARVLKPDGKIICEEALHHNPIFMLYRRMTPKLRTAWEVEHILGRDSITHSRVYFDGLNLHFFHLAQLLAVPFRRTKLFLPLMRVFALADDILLNIPGLRWMAWICVFELSKPKKT